MKTAALYLRISVKDIRTTENQRRELEAAAARLGYQILEVYEDSGFSGAKGRDKRPAFDRLHKDITRHKFDIVMVWSVDRLGRSMQDLVSFLNEIRASGVDLYLHQQALDTSTPSGRAMFQMLGVFAEFERSMIQERVHAGLARARAKGKVLGRPPIAPGIVTAIREAYARGDGSYRTLAKKFGVALMTVQKCLKPESVLQ
jgi:DNA invertase Pin-like site-specific DNA recombinase